MHTSPDQQPSYSVAPATECSRHFANRTSPTHLQLLMNYSTARSICFSRQRLTIMATSSGGAAARRKRPWRKPREAKGPDEPLRTVRASPLSYITGHVVVEEEARDKVCVEEQPQREEQAVMETENKQTINRDGDERRLETVVKEQ